VKPAIAALTIAALVVGMASVGAASGATEVVSLGAQEETGPEPAPLFEPAAVGNPVSFKVTYTATPVQPLEIRQSLNCTRGSEHPGVPEKPETVTPPVSVSLSAPAGSDSCSLVAFAETPFSTGVFGTVRIEGEAVQASKFQPTPPPAKKKCKKGKKLRYGKCVKKKNPHKRGHERRH
jgi:hypothetical protein